MPTINLYDVYKSKLRKHGYNDSARFRDSFLDACRSAYGEFNSKVFESGLLTPIATFDEVIDQRLMAFTDITFDASSNSSISDREFWSWELDYERKSATNAYKEDIDTDLVITISNDLLTLTGGSVTCTVDLPITATVAVRVVCDNDGLSVYGNEEPLELTYTAGSDGDTITLGTITTHVISATGGMNLTRLRFYTAATILYDFMVGYELLNGGVSTEVIDAVAGYVGTLTGETWATTYTYPSGGLDERYLSSFNNAIDYHLQDGGEWSIEPDQVVESRWYRRGVRDARDIHKQNTTFIGIQG